MFCSPLSNRTLSFSPLKDFLGEQKGKIIFSALSVIALLGLTFVALSMTHTLPSGTEWLGVTMGGGAIVTLALIILFRKPNPKPLILAPSPEVELPLELYHHVLSFLGDQDIGTFSQLNKTCYAVADNEAVWKARCEDRVISLPSENNPAQVSWKRTFRAANSLNKRIGWSVSPIKKVLDYSPSLSFHVTDSNVFIGSITNIQRYSALLNNPEEIFTNNSENFFLLRTQLKYFDKKLYFINMNSQGVSLKICDLQGGNTIRELKYSYPNYEPVVTMYQHYLISSRKDGCIDIWDTTLPWRSYDYSNRKCEFLKKGQEIPSEQYSKILREAPLDENFPFALLDTRRCIQDDLPNTLLSPAETRSCLKYYLMIQEHPVLQGHSQSVQKLKVFDHTLYSYSNDKTIRAWDLNTYQCTHVHLFEEGIRNFQPTGNWLFALFKTSLKKIDLKSGKILDVMNLPKNLGSEFVISNNFLICQFHESKDFYSVPLKKIGFYDLSNGRLIKDFLIEPSNYCTQFHMGKFCLYFSTYSNLYRMDF